MQPIRDKPLDQPLPEGKQLPGCRFTLITLLEAIGAAPVLLTLLLPYVWWLTPPQQIGYCLNNLRVIATAIRSYHGATGEFPPVAIYDSNGKAIHSWRVLLLPYFDDRHCNRIYAQYDFSEPWNGPNNIKLLGPLHSYTPLVYRCPMAGSGAGSSYVAVDRSPEARLEVIPEDVTPTPARPRRAILAETLEKCPFWLAPDPPPGADSIRVSSKHGPGGMVLFDDGATGFFSAVSASNRFAPLHRKQTALAPAKFVAVNIAIVALAGIGSYLAVRRAVTLAASLVCGLVIGVAPLALGLDLASPDAYRALIWSPLVVGFSLWASRRLSPLGIIGVGFYVVWLFFQQAGPSRAAAQPISDVAEAVFFLLVLLTSLYSLCRLLARPLATQDFYTPLLMMICQQMFFAALDQT